MQPAIDVTKLNKSFGKYSILDGISLQIEPGVAYGLVGLNGAGKTTLLRVLLGLLKPDSGSVAVLGRDPWRHDPALYRQAGVILENDGFWGNLSIMENLRIFASAKGVTQAAAAEYVDEFWGKTGLPRIGKKVKHLSRGQRMQCALCRAFLGWPKVLILDEPAVALDVGAYDHFRVLVETAKRKGAALIISSHQMEAIDDLCDRVGLLRDKHLGELGSVDDIPGAASWIVASGNDPVCAQVIGLAGGSGAVFESGYWRFTVDDPATAVPRIVAALVHGGFSVNEVRPASQAFSSRIRQLYRDDDRSADGGAQ